MNASQGIPALVMVLVPTESVSPQFAATAIGLATLTGEAFGATLMPAFGGTLAQKYGLGITMWMSAGGTILVFLVALLLKETAHVRAAAHAASQVAALKTEGYAG
jgi:hypothetical protein